MLRITLFIICTLFLLYFSRRPLKNPGSHGFYRFFAFEAILLLVLLNHPYWFNTPFTPLHLLSWFLLLTSIVFVLQALILLKRCGGHGERRDMPENHSFENTIHVVDKGLYRYIRHPMYGSLLLLAWGAFFKQVTLLNTMLVFLATGFLVAAATVEERENIHFFGAPYRVYMQRTKRFIPWLF